MPTAAAAPLMPESAGIDETIAGVERLYETMTGRQAPPFEAGLRPIPVERDPGEFVEEQLDRLLGLLGSVPGFASPVSPSFSFAPAVSVCEAGDETIVRMDLPGIRREDVRVTMTGATLTVSGTRTPPGAPGETVRIAESPSGEFQRVLILAFAARGSEPTARMRDGVLEIRIARETPPAPVEKAVPVH